MNLIAVIPAHNEEAQIADTVRAVMNQTMPASRVIVVCDNCTDGTAEIARAEGAEVVRTFNNKAKKAGALNQVLQVLIPRMNSCDLIFVLDADSIIREDFIRNAYFYFQMGYDAVGGVFRGGPGGGFVGLCQRNEYARYARDLRRLHGKCLVLTGTATIFRVDALREVAWGRLGGKVYDEEVLTEDNELTLQLLHRGKRIISAPDCYLVTEVMQDWKSLARQRLRWKRGALENLCQFGLTRVTLSYWRRQVTAILSVMVTAAYLGSFTLIPFLGFHFNPFWLLISSIFMLERAITVKERGWKQMLFGFTLIPETLYDLYLQWVQAKAYVGAMLNTERGW